MKMLAFWTVIAALAPTTSALGGIEFFSRLTPNAYPNWSASWAGPVWDGQVQRVFQIARQSPWMPLYGIPNGGAVTNDRLRPFGFELYAKSGAGFSYLDPSSIQADDQGSEFEIRFTTPVRACWIFSQSAQMVEVRLGDALVASAPDDFTMSGVNVSDPSFQFDRVVFRPRIDPYYGPMRLVANLQWIAIPAPGVPVLAALAGVVSRRRRRYR
jgi:hypothetical protein